MSDQAMAVASASRRRVQKRQQPALPVPAEDPLEKYRELAAQLTETRLARQQRVRLPAPEADEQTAQEMRTFSRRAKAVQPLKAVAEEVAEVEEVKVDERVALKVEQEEKLQQVEQAVKAAEKRVQEIRLQLQLTVANDDISQRLKEAVLEQLNGYLVDASAVRIARSSDGAYYVQLDRDRYVYDGDVLTKVMRILTWGASIPFKGGRKYSIGVIDQGQVFFGLGAGLPADITWK